MSNRFALTGARIFDGDDWHEGHALVVRDGLVEAILPTGAVPSDIALVDAGDGLLVPGFVDLQVNGGGGVMLNDHPDVASIETICRAHAPFGTTALLPTLITDTPAITAAAVAAGEAAARQKVPGFLGLHLEGPHLSVARKGAHDPALIRPMTDADQAMLIAARQKLPVLLTTIAPESVEPARVAALTKAGVIVSLGHSDTGYATASAFAAAGASMVTHLFNAMSQIGNREPGLAGAAIDIGTLSAGLIADGIHVDPATIKIALRAKQGPARIVLVTDAMATIGTDMTSFTLNGRTIYRRHGSLRLGDGTLAGADLDMISAIRFTHRVIGVELSEALRMASLYPAQAIGQSHRLGRFANGTAADIVALSDDLDPKGVWIGGEKVFGAGYGTAH
ncbi:N-acetylglucosamine-6-phosphate deacetylase [Mesorhizobium sp. M7A.F.Ca.US.006.04.2.1]|uniref:N-acetylglucosamine-6-phosphate deacetylase n=1 Tax=Mesorhizobium ciceri biovar biserrulae (strain HAMBI 2942 / LMG 23838 / WSM1271) TaxID=765698 RepID=E8TEQ5_MESCW|nr:MULTISPECIES: N-acetylglucosamine-6-phosphate deacetylase [Mesorhizobium]RVA44466.1 N-acetylglucosamine-6-phosphate deacetylase [Mesorhizobium sp. M7A.F.Ca.US.001.01.1.1]ADV09884.1 N-acetylglucosamine-6-phosphate deacetylase [Mesorhizobium ciceri biovar biserrulae WSM1271]MBZ9719710.1 N-acetylglucosamine-6-phosphate deacetylase [Mesorhizobium sp. AD1-1]MBZ9890076.1 N-acetylglucosamine-6-phosphate deacetylase [Mesorhizobium sp. BR1-1-3]MDF3152483.1 N-acetylglucosamine-6-phosphate deacetylase